MKYNFTTEFKKRLYKKLEEGLKRQYKLSSAEELRMPKGLFKIAYDIFFESKKQIVIIEIEFKRADPVSNIIKTIYWICARRKNKSVTLIQLFNEAYYKKAYMQKELALFIGKKIHSINKKADKYFTYFPFTLDIPENKMKSNIKSTATRYANHYAKILLKRIP